jgi:hypothetical protein
LTVQADPRVAVDPAAVNAALLLSDQVVVALDRHFIGNGEIHAVHDQVAALEKKIAGDSKKDALAKTLKDFDAKLAPLTSGEGEDALNLGAIGDAFNSLESDLEASDRMPSQPQREVARDYGGRLDRALANWSSIKASDLPALNQSLKVAGLDPIRVPTRAQIAVVDPGVSKEMP